MLNALRLYQDNDKSMIDTDIFNQTIQGNTIVPIYRHTTCIIFLDNSVIS